jgi:hypothetical protein
MIVTEQRMVYVVRYGGCVRAYLTKRAAARRLAREIIQNKYPKESPDYGSDGRCEYPGWSWEELKRSDVLYRRLTKLCLKSIVEEMNQCGN